MRSAMPPCSRNSLPVLQIARPRGEISDYTLMAGMNALLDMALCAGDAAVADRLLEAEGIFPNQVTLGVLARRGDSARLAALTQARPDVIHNDSGWGMEYDDLLHSRLPAVLEAMANEDDRLLLRATFAALPDGKNAAAFPPRAERVAALASVMVAHPWRSPLLRDRALAALIVEPALPSVLQPLLDEAAARVPFTVVWGLRDRTYRNEVTESHLYTVLHATRLHAALRRGDLAPLQEVLRSYMALPAQVQKAGERRRETLMESASTTLLAAWTEFSPEQRSAVCAGWLSCMELLGPVRLSAHEIRLSLLFHLLAGQEAAWEQWCGQRDAALRAYIIESISELDSHVDSIIPQGMDKLPGTPEDQVRVTAGIFVRLAKYTLWRGNFTLDEQFLRGNLGTREDFMKLEPGVLAAAGENPWSVFAFARCLARMERWPEVLARTEKALAALPPSGDSAWLPLVELHVEALAHTGRTAETEAWLTKARAVELPLDAKFTAIITGAHRRLVK
jgi:hypothetical protein